MIETPYLLFLGDAPDGLAAKVAQGIKDWRPDNAVGQYRMEGCKADLGLPDMTLAEAKAAEALGLARAQGFEAQKEALGPAATAVVAAINAIAEGGVNVMPEVLVAGGGAGSIEGLAASLIKRLGTSPAPAGDTPAA